MNREEQEVEEYPENPCSGQGAEGARLFFRGSRISQAKERMTDSERLYAFLLFFYRRADPPGGYFVYAKSQALIGRFAFRGAYDVFFRKDQLCCISCKQ